MWTTTTLRAPVRVLRAPPWVTTTPAPVLLPKRKRQVELPLYVVDTALAAKELNFELTKQQVVSCVAAFKHLTDDGIALQGRTLEALRFLLRSLIACLSSRSAATMEHSALRAVVSSYLCIRKCIPSGVLEDEDDKLLGVLLSCMAGAIRNSPFIAMYPQAFSLLCFTSDHPGAPELVKALHDSFASTDIEAMLRRLTSTALVQMVTVLGLTAAEFKHRGEGAAKVPSLDASALPHREKILSSIAHLFLDPQRTSTLFPSQIVTLFRGLQWAKTMCIGTYRLLLLRAVSPTMLPGFTSPQLCEIAYRSSRVLPHPLVRECLGKISSELQRKAHEVLPSHIWQCIKAFATVRAEDFPLFTVLTNRMRECSDSADSRSVTKVFHCLSWYPRVPTHLVVTMSQVALESSAITTLSPSSKEFVTLLNTLTKLVWGKSRVGDADYHDRTSSVPVLELFDKLVERLGADTKHLSALTTVEKGLVIGALARTGRVSDDDRLRGIFTTLLTNLLNATSSMDCDLAALTMWGSAKAGVQVVEAVRRCTVCILKHDANLAAHGLTWTLTALTHPDVDLREGSPERRLLTSLLSRMTNPRAMHQLNGREVTTILAFLARAGEAVSRRQLVDALVWMVVTTKAKEMPDSDIVSFVVTVIHLSATPDLDYQSVWRTMLSRLRGRLHRMAPNDLQKLLYALSKASEEPSVTAPLVAEVESRVTSFSGLPAETIARTSLSLAQMNAATLPVVESLVSCALSATDLDAASLQMLLWALVKTDGGESPALTRLVERALHPDVAVTFDARISGFTLWCLCKLAVYPTDLISMLAHTASADSTPLATLSLAPTRLLLYNLAVHSEVPDINPYLELLAQHAATLGLASTLKYKHAKALVGRLAERRCACPALFRDLRERVASHERSKTQ